jgi:hypothetical protein
MLDLFYGIGTDNLYKSEVGESAIMEKFSKKRGRKASPMGQVIEGLFPEVGKRSQNNKAWMTHACWALGHPQKTDPAHAWILEQTSQGEWRRETLLSELGRLNDPKLINQVATYICQQKPNVKDGIVMVRGYRQSLQGKKPRSPDPLKLSNEIIHTINSYLRRYPEITNEQIIAALETAVQQVRKP